MSTNIIVLNTGQQAIITKDVSNIFVFNNRFETVVYTNPTGGNVTLKAGQVMGKIASSNKVIPLIAAAVDGSQYPVGIVNKTITVAAGVTVNISICVAGDVVKDKLLFNASETLATVVELKTIGDRIGSDTVGIKLVTSTEMTAFDNV